MEGLKLRMTPKQKPVNENCLNANEWGSLCKIYKRLFVAAFINALAFFCIAEVAQAHVNLQMISAGGVQEILQKTTSEPASIALSGAGLLVVGAVIRRRRSERNPGSRQR